MKPTHRAAPKHRRLTRKQWLADLSHAQRERLRYLEARLQWDGRLNRADICRVFDVTKNHVTRELGDYQHYFPDQMRYDPAARAYHPLRGFKPRISKGEITECLSFAIQEAGESYSAVVADFGVPTSRIAEPVGRVPNSILRQVRDAIREGTALRIQYQSFNRDAPVERVIWPKVMVWTGERWHIRAYDNLRNEYRDFVPQRINRALSVEEPPSGTIAPDHDWEESETIEIVPNPLLTTRQQEIVANEYGMITMRGARVWRVSVRRCLIAYFLRRYRLDEVGPLPPTPQSVRVVLKDPSIAQRFRFPTD